MQKWRSGESGEQRSRGVEEQMIIGAEEERTGPEDQRTRGTEDQMFMGT